MGSLNSLKRCYHTGGWGKVTWIRISASKSCASTEFSVESHVHLLNHAKIISNNENSVLVLLLSITKKSIFWQVPEEQHQICQVTNINFLPKQQTQQLVCKTTMEIQACCGLLMLVKSNVSTTAIRTIIEVTLVVDSPRFLLVLADISSNGVVIPWWPAHFPLGLQVEKLFKTQYKTKICPCKYCRTSLWLSIELLFTFITAIFVKQCYLEETNSHGQLVQINWWFSSGRSSVICPRFAKCASWSR